MMSFEEFESVEPRLAASLQTYTGHPKYAEITLVFKNDEGRWEAHLLVPPYYDFDRVREARCKPNCLRGSGYRYTWVYDSHVCCEACEADPGHRYQTVHE